MQTHSSKRIPFHSLFFFFCFLNMNHFYVSAVNCFGFGGANGHLLLKWNKKEKANNVEYSDDLPLLICVSSRTEEGLRLLIQDIESHKFNPEYATLLHGAFK